MARTYEPIASTSLSDDLTRTVTFSNIPGTYTDLVLVCFLRANEFTFNSTNYPHLRFNSDTGTNYSYTRLYARSTSGSWSALSERTSNTTDMGLVGISMTSSNSNIFTPVVYQIMSYANTNVFKTTLARNAQVSNLTNEDGPAAAVGLWRSTSAITSVSLNPSQATSEFVSGSTFSLFGVKAQ